MLIKTYNQETIEIDLPDLAGNLIALPALIDPHVHFRTPGQEHKEDWVTGAQAALAGGVTTVLDMPNNDPAITGNTTLQLKKDLIAKQLAKVDIPLHYYLYLGATGDNLKEIRQLKDKVVAIKVFMGSSTGNLLVAEKNKQADIFKLAAELDLPVAVHAEDEAIINTNQAKINQPTITDHSKIRSREAAIKAVTQAIELAKKYDSKLYILHLSTKEEIELVKQAKSEGIKVFAETTPHHLFLNQSAYTTQGTKVQMNPPLRTEADNQALWQAINDNLIATIGTDHAPHTLAEKNPPYPQSPSGVPGIETNLPLLLNAHNENRISLEKIVELTRTNPQKIFKLRDNNDWVIVDLDLTKTIVDKNLKTKCGWSPFSGLTLKGWPIATILNNTVYKL